MNIKPCPFCGSDAELKQTGKMKARIRCKRCLIGIEQKTLRFSFQWLEQKLIESWNLRVDNQTKTK